MINQRNSIIFILFILIIFNTSKQHIETFDLLNTIASTTSDAILFPITTSADALKRFLSAKSEKFIINVPDVIPNYED